MFNSLFFSEKHSLSHSKIFVWMMGVLGAGIFSASSPVLATPLQHHFEHHYSTQDLDRHDSDQHFDRHQKDRNEYREHHDHDRDRHFGHSYHHHYSDHDAAILGGILTLGILGQSLGPNEPYPPYPYSTSPYNSYYNPYPPQTWHLERVWDPYLGRWVSVWVSGP